MNNDEMVQLAKERNSLAIERTFLAWVRTGLALVGGGFAIMRLLILGDVEHKHLIVHIGQALVVLGVIIFMFAYYDYRESIKVLKLSKRIAGSVTAITALIFILAITTILLFIILAV